MYKHIAFFAKTRICEIPQIEIMMCWAFTGSHNRINVDSIQAYKSTRGRRNEFNWRRMISELF